jgi:hypothetical protein
MAKKTSMRHEGYREFEKFARFVKTHTVAQNPSSARMRAAARFMSRHKSEAATAAHAAGIDATRKNIIEITRLSKIPVLRNPKSGFPTPNAAFAEYLVKNKIDTSKMTPGQRMKVFSNWFEHKWG